MTQMSQSEHKELVMYATLLLLVEGLPHPNDVRV